MLNSTKQYGPDTVAGFDQPLEIPPVPVPGKTVFFVRQGEPIAFASHVADDPPVADVQPLAVGDAAPDMPLFLDPGHDVSVPLSDTYAENVRRLPEPLREALSG